jgi:hypothetical protein
MGLKRHWIVAAIATMAFLLVAAVLFAPLLFQPRCHDCVGSTKAMIRTVGAALIHYQTDSGQRCPQRLDVLVREQYLTKEPVDAWQRPLEFVCPGEHDPEGADIASAGADGKFGTADDIHSWDF